MTLYNCYPYQTFQVFDYVKEKWYKKGKYVPREKKEIYWYDSDIELFIYANSKEEAEEKYFKRFNKIKLNSYLYISYYHYDYEKGYKIFEDKLENETFLYIKEYENNKTLSYLKKHMNSDDYLLYCKQILLDNDIEYMI